MDAKFIAGSAFGVPVRGSIVSLGSADIPVIIGAASGLAKTLLFSGVSALALGIAGIFLLLGDEKEEKRMRLDHMSKIHGHDRKYFGICLSECIEIMNAGQRLKIPTEYIQRICRSGGYGGGYETVFLFDGSSYKIDTTQTGIKTLEFLTILGKQEVRLFDPNLVPPSIYGGTVKEKKVLVNNLNLFLNEKNESIVKTIGKERFEKYFYPSR